MPLGGHCREGQSYAKLNLLDGRRKRERVRQICCNSYNFAKLNKCWAVFKAMQREFNETKKIHIAMRLFSNWS